jgi:broad specificity phosphatase PhoE
VPLVALLRHGEDAAAIRPGGPIDAPADRGLTPTGRRQAVAAREFLASLEVDEVVVSESPRALETAEIIADGRPVCAEAALAGLNLGEWSGRPASELPELERVLTDPLARPPGGESLSELLGRARPVFRRVLAGARDAIVISHRMVNAVLLAELIGLPIEVAALIQQDPGAVNVIQLGDRRAHVAMVNLNLLDPLRRGVLKASLA